MKTFLIVENMNVCLLTPYPPQTGGVAVHSSNLVKNLSERHNIFIVTYGRLGRKGGKNVEILEVPVIDVKFLRGLSYFIGSIVTLFVLKRRSKIDIIHSQYMHPMGTVALLYRKIAKKKPKIIVTAHGADLLSLGSMRVVKRLISWIGNSCDRIICVSKYLSARAEGLGIKKGKIKVVYNGMDDAEFPRRSRDHLRKELDLPDKKKILTFAGSLSEAKGADVFVILAKHLLGKEKDLFFNIKMLKCWILIF